MSQRPYDRDYSLNAIVLGATRSPGQVTLSGHDRVKAWDNQAAKGSTGATSKLNGDPIGTFKASFYLVDDSADPDADVNDFDAWETFQRLIESTTKGPKPKALPIYHPDLLRNGFFDVVEAGISGLVHDGKGGATVVVTFQEYKPPKPKKVVSATGGTAKKPGTTAAPDPNAARKAELDRLVAEAKKP